MQLRPTQRALTWATQPFFRWSLAIAGAVAAGIAAFEVLDISVFRRIGMPHELCYLREPKLVWLHVATDFLIGAAYVSISATLGYLVYKASRGIPFNWMFLAFGLFIVSCGFTHFMEVWVIWDPVYWMSGYVKVVTAGASVATAIALFPLLPKIFRLVESARESERRRLEIEHLNQELQRFNYSVAHDLRAPLRGISGFAQALREDYAPQLPPPAVDYLGRMEKSADRMDALISDLLKYSMIGRQELELRPVALDDVLRSALALLDAELRARDAEVVAPESLPLVFGDATLLQAIFQNLIGNGIKFVAPGVRPRVEVSARREGDTVILSFVDNGLGIPPEARPKVFGLFERFHPRQSGTGIGLAIVFRAVQRLNGTIGVEAGPGGEGTLFWIRLRAA